jgi:hypothetical protein
MLARTLLFTGLMDTRQLINFHLQPLKMSKAHKKYPG